MAIKEIDVLEVQENLEAIVDGFSPGDSVVVMKDGKPHARLGPITQDVIDQLKKARELDQEEFDRMNPEILAMFDAEAERKDALFGYSAGTAADDAKDK